MIMLIAALVFACLASALSVAEFIYLRRNNTDKAFDFMSLEVLALWLALIFRSMT